MVFMIHFKKVSMNVNYIAIICLLSINVIYSNEVMITKFKYEWCDNDNIYSVAECIHMILQMF